jgi:RNA polymerase sigma factor (sigma-70 family)
MTDEHYNNTDDSKEFLKQTNHELFKMYAEEKDLRVRNELAIRNQRLVTFILKKYYSHGRIPEETRKELLQEGTIGLLSAIEGYDHKLGFKFSTYATWWIKQAVNNYLINVNPIIRVPGHIKAAQNRLLKELKLRKEDITNLLDIEAKDFDISEKMLNSINSAIRSRHVTSLQNPIGKAADAGSTLEDLIPSSQPESETDDVGRGAHGRDFDQKIMIRVVKEALKAMPEKRKLILLLRYGVIKEKDLKKIKPEATIVND